MLRLLSGARQLSPGSVVFPGTTERRVGVPAAQASAGVPSPLIAQLAQLNKHRACVGALAEVWECVTQTRDDGGALESEERVDVLLFPEGRNGNCGGILLARLSQQGCGARVVGLPIEREFEIACHVLVPRKHTRTIR